MAQSIHFSENNVLTANQNQDSFQQFNADKDVALAKAFHHEFLLSVENASYGLKVLKVPQWAQQILRKKKREVAIIEKIGSNSFAKRRPQDIGPYTEYVQKRLVAEEPLLFRIPVGPLKNMYLGDGNQLPDLAEYLMLVQLARFAMAIASLYPHGVQIQLVPDDVRARAANKCPEQFTQEYITSLRRLVSSLQFDPWLKVENGQARLCDMYNVMRYREEAERKLSVWKEKEAESFAERWEIAIENARKNFVITKDEQYEAEIAASAWRYMVAHQSEILSGMWSPKDIFPLVYANHPNCYQIFSLGTKKTKLPWQIALPISLLNNEECPSALLAT